MKLGLYLSRYLLALAFAGWERWLRYSIDSGLHVLKMAQVGFSDALNV
jgi:hypothetical protein